MIALLFVAAIIPHTSVDRLVSSNGNGTVGYSLSAQKFDRFIQHSYKYEAENTPTRNLMVDSYFGARLGGQAVWFSSLPVSAFRYVTGTGIFVVEQSWPALPDVVFRTYGFAPRTLGGAGFVMALEVENDSGLDISSLEVFALNNLVSNGERPDPSGTGEYIFVDDNGAYVVEGALGNSGAATEFLALNNASSRTAGGGASSSSWSSNPYHVLADLNAEFGDTFGSAFKGYNADNVATGYEWQFATVADRTSVWAGVAVSSDSGTVSDQAKGRLSDWLSGVNDAQALVARETAAWSQPTLPAAMPSDEQALYAQSLAVLQMAQVKELGALGDGQILASISAATSDDSNQWNIAWVRDMAYSVVALSEAGHFDAARAALRFQLEANSGNFATQVGAPYQISVCRYFGNGNEESDSNENGNNIELDGPGLFLWSLERYVTLSGDTGVLDDYWKGVISPLVADVLVQAVEPYSGLVKADSSIWEVHWNGQQKQFAYTSITAATGLCAAGALADLEGDKDRGITYRNTARGIREAISKNLVDRNNVLAGTLEQLHAGSNYLDASVVDALGFNLFSGQAAFATPTIRALDTALRLPSGGYERNQNGGAYDSAEWVFVDTRYALAAAKTGGVTNDLYRWVVDQSSANANLVAELYDPATADYSGSVPMVGFGAGAFVIAANHRYGLASDPTPCGGYDDTLETPIAPKDAPVVGEVTPPAAKKKGCSQSGDEVWYLVVLAMALVRPRRPA